MWHCIINDTAGSGGRFPYPSIWVSIWKRVSIWSISSKFCSCSGGRRGSIRCKFSCCWRFWRLWRIWSISKLKRSGSWRRRGSCCQCKCSCWRWRSISSKFSSDSRGRRGSSRCKCGFCWRFWRFCS